MDSVFVVFHEYEMSGGHDDSKLIGVYASKELAEAAVARVIDQSGFRNYPQGFSIDQYEINKDHWQEGFGGPDPT